MKEGDHGANGKKSRGRTPIFLFVYLFVYTRCFLCPSCSPRFVFTPPVTSMFIPLTYPPPTFSHSLLFHLSFPPSSIHPSQPTLSLCSLSLCSHHALSSSAPPTSPSALSSSTFLPNTHPPTHSSIPSSKTNHRANNSSQSFVSFLIPNTQTKQRRTGVDVD
ncbi:MAG: hypothetical protein JOS17DRAFT_272684 [Linnemannia elongata]|nr:MAG: hypothetical protein JOS17DRAFT_272684 [Linnemannia elongata]